MSKIPIDHLGSEPDGPVVGWIELAEQICIRGRKLHDELSRLVGRWQLSPPQFSLLWVWRLTPGEGWGQNELAAALAVSPAQVSGLVEQLRRKGLLEGRRPAADRRRQLWRLTPDGRDTLEAILADQRHALDRLANQLVDLLDQSTAPTDRRGAA